MEKITLNDGDLFYSEETKPDFNDRKNPFGEFEMGFRKVKLDKSGAGYVKAAGGKYSRSGLEKHAGKWVYVWVDHYYGVTARVGTDWFNNDLSNRISGVTCHQLKDI